MKRLLLFLTLLAVVVVVPAFAENNTVLKVHVEKAVAIPGNVLEPGDYIFRLVNNDAGLRVVAVSSADYKTIYGFIPVYSANRTGYADEIREAKAVDGLGRIDSWFFPGEQHGYRFIYSKSDLHKADMYAQQMKSRGGVEAGQ